MRTKNAKRLWPVPVTLGVMALAALLAFGLLAVPNAQPAAAQDVSCDVAWNNSNQNVPVAAETCEASADSVNVVFQTGSGEGNSYWVATEGGTTGTEYENVKVGIKGTGDDEVDVRVDLTVDTLTVTGGDGPDAVDETIEVGRSQDQNDDGTVILYVYGFTAKRVISGDDVGKFNGFLDDDDNNTTPSDNGELDTDDGSSYFTVTVTFLGEPVADDKNTDATDGSTFADALVSDDGAADFTLVVRDEHGKVLHPNNASAFATVTVTDPTNKATINGVRTNSRVINLESDDDGSTFTVGKLAKTGAVKAAVSVEVRTARGEPLTLMANATRLGNADAITFNTYRCAVEGDGVVDGPDSDETADSPDDYCRAEARALATKSTKDDPTATDVFTPDDVFLVHAKVVDSLGQELKQNAESADDGVDLVLQEKPASGDSKAFTILRPARN